MTLTHLIPLSHFVDKIDEIVPRKKAFAADWRISQIKAIKRYTAFLLEPLTLSMFVPVSDSGEVLEEPEYNAIDYGVLPEGAIRFKKDMEAYNKAKEKCLFEGFELINNKFFLNEKLIWFAELKGKIEDLTHLNLPLTARAIEQILG